jgi:hypothetical protein
MYQATPPAELAQRLLSGYDELNGLGITTLDPLAAHVQEKVLGMLQDAVELAGFFADHDGQHPTGAQGLALAKFLRSQFRDRMCAAAHVYRGGVGLPDDYLHVVFPHSGYEGGIDPEGRTST